MEKFRNLKLWQIIVIGIVIVIGINMLFFHHSKQADEKSNNKTSPSSAPFFSSKKSIPTDYVKVPETYLKQKSQVEEEFKQSGLSVNFVTVNFDNKSDISGKTISNGMCDQISEQSSLKYFSASEYYDYGDYAKKGAKITVGYSDHDYTPKSMVDDSKESTSEKSRVSSSNNATESANVSNLLSEYDSFINKIKDTSNKVSGMNDTEKLNGVTDLIQEQTTITEKYDDLKQETLTTSESTELMNKSIDMLQEYNKLMAKLQDK